MNVPRRAPNLLATRSLRPSCGLARGRFAVFFMLVGLGVVSVPTVLAPLSADAAKAKSTTKKAATPPTTKLKPGAFSPGLLAGKWKWVKSIATVRFKDGTDAVSDIAPVPGSILTFTRTKSSAGQVLGDFAGQDYQGNPMSGLWVLEDRVLRLFFYGAEGASIIRSVSTLTSGRLALTGNDQQVAEPLKRFATGGPKDAVGGSAYDELIRVK